MPDIVQNNSFLTQHPRSAGPANINPQNSYMLISNSTTANSSDSEYTHGLSGVTLGLDNRLLIGLWVSMLMLALALLVLRLCQRFHAHLRRIYSMAAERAQQNYFSYDKDKKWPLFKRHMLYAPLGTKRHNREIQLSKAHNYGTIPSRANTLLIMVYVIINVTYISILDYGNTNAAARIAELRGRSGVLATANMILLVVLAARNNPLIPFLKISYNTFNLYHRWLGRVIIVEALIHTMAWGINELRIASVGAAFQTIGQDPFLVVGTVAVAALITILFQSLSPIRHAFYEIFLHLHQLLALITVIGIYIHLEMAKLPSLPYIRAVVGFWAAERGLRTVRLLYLNLSRRNGSTHVLVEAMPGDACRVTFQLPRHITIRPGSHVYAYLPKVSAWMSHPFSVAWTNIESEPPTGYEASKLQHVKRLKSAESLEKTPRSLESQFPQELPPRDLTKAPTSISLIIAARSGMTRKLYDLAMASEQREIRMSGYLEGPYAGHDSLASYGTVILFAGGAGITHHLIQVRHLIAAANAKTVATRKIVLVWTVRDVEQLSWTRPWMDEILLMENRRDILKVLLFVSKPKKTEDLVSPSATVKLLPGRCSPGKVLDEELAGRIGATAVSVCGPGAFADEVRHAVRERLNVGVIDYMEEEFTW